ncbi:Ig-like domain-containing protein, partial [Geitlerinema sp. PCC 9228]|uniref:Ig-like domain-containing protein n=1 Tax=Geitlerinema sp. PCC 9228 TaxID=111611 RepID=UPI001FCD947E
MTFDRLPRPNVTITSDSIDPATVLAGTSDHPLYQLNLAASDGDAQLNSITFTPNGSYKIDDISEFQLVYSTDTILGDDDDTSLGTKTPVPPGNSLTFSNLTQTISNGSTGSLFLTADIAADATQDKTLKIDAPALSDINFAVTFAVTNKVGTPTEGATQTFDVIPAVTNVTLPSDKTYGIDSNLNFEVTFSEAVTIDEGSGSAVLPLTLDSGDTVNATLVGNGTSATTHTFRYTVASGHEDTNGIKVGTDLTLNNNATIQDATNNNATLTLEGVDSTTDILVDGIAPTLNLTSSSNDTVAGTFSVTAKFSEQVSGFDSSDITVDNGSIENFNQEDATTYTFDVTPAADDKVTVDVVANQTTDTAGNKNTAATQLSRTADLSAPNPPEITTSGSTNGPLSGTAEPEAEVEILQKGRQSVEKTTADQDGNWNITL